MAKRMFLRNFLPIGKFCQETFVLVSKSIRTRVVRWINVDNINFATVSVIQASECVVVVAFDNHMGRSARQRTFRIYGLFSDFFKNWNFVFGILVKSFWNIHPVEPITNTFDLRLPAFDFFFQFVNTNLESIQCFCHVNLTAKGVRPYLVPFASLLQIKKRGVECTY